MPHFHECFRRRATEIPADTAKQALWLDLTTLDTVGLLLPLLYFLNTLTLQPRPRRLPPLPHGGRPAYLCGDMAGVLLHRAAAHDGRDAAAVLDSHVPAPTDERLAWADQAVLAHHAPLDAGQAYGRVAVVLDRVVGYGSEVSEEESIEARKQKARKQKARKKPWFPYLVVEYADAVDSWAAVHCATAAGCVHALDRLNAALAAAGHRHRVAPMVYGIVVTRVTDGAAVADGIYVDEADRVRTAATLYVYWTAADDATWRQRWLAGFDLDRAEGAARLRGFLGRLHAWGAGERLRQIRQGLDLVSGRERVEEESVDEEDDLFVKKHDW